MKTMITALLASVALCAAVPLQVHAELDVVKLKTAIETSVESDYPKLDALYKDIHAHPELAFQEVKTAAKLAADMRAIGFDVTEGVGKTGVVAIYRNGDGPTIMVRTELDALPMEEKTGLPTPATTRPPGMAARPSSRIAAATISTWRTGSEPRTRCSVSKTSGRAT